MNEAEIVRVSSLESRFQFFFFFFFRSELLKFSSCYEKSADKISSDLPGLETQEFGFTDVGAFYILVPDIRAYVI